VIRHLLRGSRVTSLAAAVVAVLAAFGTLYSHHRSISALTAKNQAILAQARATDTYNAYEAKQIRYNIYQALLATDIVTNAESRARMQSVAQREQTSSPILLEQAKAFEKQAELADERSETSLKSYETLLFATTLFEISIIVVSLAALGPIRVFVPLGSALSAVGIVLLVLGLFQGG
jgi:hypothetical protein